MKKEDAYYDQVNLEDEFDLDNAEFQKSQTQAEAQLGSSWSTISHVIYCSC